jgi:hypothetical protein
MVSRDTRLTGRLFTWQEESPLPTTSARRHFPAAAPILYQQNNSAAVIHKRPPPSDAHERRDASASRRFAEHLDRTLTRRPPENPPAGSGELAAPHGSQRNEIGGGGGGADTSSEVVWWSRQSTHRRSVRSEHQPVGPHNLQGAGGGGSHRPRRSLHNKRPAADQEPTTFSAAAASGKPEQGIGGGGGPRGFQQKPDPSTQITSLRPALGQGKWDRGQEAPKNGVRKNRPMERGSEQRRDGHNKKFRGGGEASSAASGTAYSDVVYSDIIPPPVPPHGGPVRGKSNPGAQGRPGGDHTRNDTASRKKLSGKPCSVIPYESALIRYMYCTVHIQILYVQYADGGIVLFSV